MEPPHPHPLRPCLALACIWLAAHALPLFWLTDGHYDHWEIVQAHKVLDYGFAARAGAMLSPGAYVGQLANPADYNYVHHPYPIFWLYTLLYGLFGKAGVYVLASATALAGSLLTWRVLTRFFPPRAAWFAAVLFTIAHANVEFATNTDFFALSAIVWPIAVLAIVRLKEAAEHERTRRAWVLGVIIFLGGQISWLSLSAIPALMLLCIPHDLPLGTAIRRPWSIPGWRPMLLGGTLSLALFIANVVIYSAGLHGDADYIALQMGLGDGFLSSRLSKLPVLALRTALAAPALWLGAIACLPHVRQRLPERRLPAAMLLYIAIFALIIFTIPRLLSLNQNVTRLIVFPCALLTATALTFHPGRMLRGSLALLGAGGLLFCYGKLHDYRASAASLALAGWLGPNTAPDEFVFANFTRLTPPVSSWDGEFAANASVAADRLLFSPTTTATELAAQAQAFTPHIRRISILLDDSQPIDPAFRAQAEANSTDTLRASVPVPHEAVMVFKTARETMWKLLGTHAPQYAAPTTGAAAPATAFHLTLYRLSPEYVRRINEHASPPR